jgi:uncharacterized protein (TIGR00255 family)
MSISGMTGFARAEGEYAGQRWIWEARSVNGRGLDLKLRLPSGLDALEPPARAAAQARFKRGSLQLSLNIARDPAQAPPVKIDFPLVERLIRAGEFLVLEGKVEKARWDGLLSVRGVLQSEDAEMDAEARAALETALLAGLEQALDALAAARQAEGRMLATALGELADTLDHNVKAARGLAAAAPETALARIRQRLAGLAPEVQFDPQRLAQEAALAASRADVQEEIDRLTAHAGELRVLLTKPEPAGRRLEFLGQELTREANTLVAKAADLELTRIGLELKTVVDQIKEQAANVE